MHHYISYRAKKGFVMLKLLVKGLVVCALLAVLLSGSSFATKVYAAGTQSKITISCSELQAEISQDQQIESDVSQQLSNFQLFNNQSSNAQTAANKFVTDRASLLQDLQDETAALQNQASQAGC
jgi:septal ring factor EnvC (AmiA/AmiB activator)